MAGLGQLLQPQGHPAEVVKGSGDALLVTQLALDRQALFVESPRFEVLIDGQGYTSWDESPSPFSQTAIASLHEWLHNVSFYAHRVMGDMAVPDCHAGEEYGYWDLDGGYPQWQAWNRDLMLRYIPRSFWYRLTSQGPLLPPGAPPTFRSPDAGPFFRWDEVAHDWMRKLPRLDESELRRLTGLPDLNIETGQPGPNSHLIWGSAPPPPLHRCITPALSSPPPAASTTSSPTVGA
jgi:hypothetical protein